MRRDTPAGALVRALARLVSSFALLVEALAGRVRVGSGGFVVEGANPSRGSHPAPSPPEPRLRLAMPDDEPILLALRKLGYSPAEARSRASRASGDTLAARVSSALAQRAS